MNDFQPGFRDSRATGPVRKRPAGVIVAAIVLGFLGCGGLFSSFSILAVALFSHTPQMPQMPPGMVGVQIAMGFMILIVSAICVLVVIGLFQMKRWARIGTLILGGLLAVFYGLGAVGCLVFALSSLVNQPNAAGAPNVTPAMMRMAFLGLACAFFVLALVGVWWLVYFNLRRVRELFATNGVVATPEFAGGLADGEIAATPAVRRRSLMEILVVCLAVVYFLGAVNGLILAAMKLPLFFFGVILRGAAGEVFSLAFAAISVALGIGLLRRVKLAWMGAVALQAVGVLSGLMLFLPRTRVAMAAYQLELQQRMSTWLPTSPGAVQFTQTPSTLIFSAVFGLVIGLAILWLLLRARPLFEK